MKDILYTLLIVFCINGMVFLGQVSVTKINPNAPIFYNYDGSLISDYDAGNYTVTEDLSGLPTSADAVSPDDNTNIFTDAFKTFKSWVEDVTGVKYLKAFVNAVPNLFKAFGLPQEISFILGVIWHATIFFLVVMWLKGGD